MRPLFVTALALMLAACVPPPRAPRAVPPIDPAPAAMRPMRVLVDVTEAANADRKFRDFHGNTCLAAVPREICPPADAQERLARAVVAALQQGGFAVSTDRSAPFDVAIRPSLYAMYAGACRAHAPSATTEAEREPTYCGIFAADDGLSAAQQKGGPRATELHGAIVHMAEGRACRTREGDVGMPQWLVADPIEDERPPNYAYLAADLVRTLEGCDGLLAYASVLGAEAPALAPRPAPTYSPSP